MRSAEEMQELIINVAKEDERIRGIILSGSRADSNCPRDVYQDFDVVYNVADVTPFWDNMEWIEAKFGRPSLIQKPESIQLIAPDGNGNFVYLMVFPDGNRIDLTITSKKYTDDGEPAIVLLDKDGIYPDININPEYWYVKAPGQKVFKDCANEFHWCMNNVAKGIARDEIPYAMEMLNHYVRDMLQMMIGWYIGTQFDFKVSVGKSGKYFKRYLSEEQYNQYLRTYAPADHDTMWKAAFEMMDLFGTIARQVADKLGFDYDEEEEEGILDYMNLVKNGI